MYDEFTSESGKKYRLINSINQGYSSKVYIVRRNDTDYILKIPYDDRAFEKETQMLLILEENKFPAPRLFDKVDFLGKKGIVLSYVQGNNGENINLNKINISRLVSLIGEFQEINSQQANIPVYDLYMIRQNYEKNLQIAHEYISNRASSVLKGNVEYVFEMLKNREFSKLVHGDLRLDNIFFTRDGFSFIDFECCIISDPIQNLIKIYHEVLQHDKKLGEYFLEEYASTNNYEYRRVFQILRFYVLLDKISAIVWCKKRQRIGGSFFYQNIQYIENEAQFGL